MSTVAARNKASKPPKGSAAPAATRPVQATPLPAAGAAGKGTKAVKYRSAAALARRAEKRRNQGGGPV